MGAGSTCLDSSLRNLHAKIISNSGLLRQGELGRRRKYADRCEATRMKIRIPPVNESPDDADVHFLDDRINQYNFETTGINDGRWVCLNRAQYSQLPGPAAL